MAYTPYPDDMKVPSPPSYESNDTPNVGMSYQQSPHPNQSSYHGSSVPPPPQQWQQPPTPVYVQPTTYIQPFGGFLSHYPQAVQCAACRQQVITVVQYVPGAATWLIALLVCFFGGAFGCCLIPFCIPSCQDAIHTCPSCFNQIGRHSAF